MEARRAEVSQLEDDFAFQIRAAKVPYPIREFRPVPTRRWRVDFAWPDRLVAVEIEGGTWINGRHNTGVGFQADCEKYSTLAIEGWCVIRATGQQVKSGVALKWVECALGSQSSKTPTALPASRCRKTMTGQG